MSSRTSRGIVAALLALTAVVLFILQVREAVTRADRRVGIAIDTGDLGMEVTYVEEGLPADRAGIRPGDTIVAIEGHQVQKSLDYEIAAQGLERGRTATYHVWRHGQRLRFQLVPGVEFPAFRLASDTMALLGFLTLSLLSLLQGIRDVRTRLLFVFSTAVAFELALPYDAIGSPFVSSPSIFLYYLLIGLEIGSGLHLASVVPQPQAWIRRRPLLVWTYYGVGLGLGTMCALTHLMEDDLHRDVFPWSSFQIDGILVQVAVPLWSCAVAAILVVQTLRADTPRGKRQAGLVLAGVMPWTFYLLVRGVLEIQGKVTPRGTGFEPLALLAYSLVVLAAIYRYQLFGIKLMVRRGISLTTELPGDGKPPLMARRLMERLGQIFAVRSVSLLLADPDSCFLVPLAAPESEEHGGLPALLVHRQDPGVEALVCAERPLPVAQLSVQGGILWSQLKQLDGSYAAPLLVERQLMGILVLGPKEAGEPFLEEELELLSFLARHVAMVFRSARLLESATYEGLTGLLRREAILEILARELDRAERHDQPLTVGMADLDHFKEVNDRYGHLMGDALLRQVAQVLTGGLRSVDAVGRYGGEEFLVVLPGTDLAGAWVVAEKLRSLVEQVHVPMNDGEEVSVTISIGLATWQDPALPENATPQDLLEHADRALYKAKQTGRNRVHPMIAKVA